jgi:hypothetical protein
MTRRVLSAAASAISTYVLVAALDAQIPQTVPRPLPQATGTGSIIGTVVSAATGQPLRGARLTLTGRPGSPSATAAGSVTAVPFDGVARTTISDREGRFSFTSLPPGRFLVEANREGFLNASYGQKNPGKPGIPVELIEGQQVEVSLRMVRGSAITGTVTDEQGEAVARARVRLLSMVTNQNGVRRMRVVNETMADDRGVYRFFNLGPNNYMVSASPLSEFEAAMARIAESGSVNFSDSSADEVMTALMQGSRNFGLVADAESGAITVTPRDDADGPSNDESFAPTYHPMSTSAAQAITIRADGLAEHAGVDIRVLAVRTATIRGTVVGVPGSDIPVQVLLHTLDPGEEPTTETVRVGPTGEFTIAGVAPGQYAVYAQTLPDPRAEGPVATSGPQIVNVPRARVASFDRLHGRSVITVDSPNPPPVTVTLRPGRSISGRVVRDFATPPTGPAARAVTTISITPSPVPAGLPAFNTSPQVQADADGRFTLPGIRPGRYFLRASGPGTVRSVMWNGVDTLDAPLEVTADTDVVDVEITLGDRTSIVTGAVTDATGKPLYEATIVAASTDSRFWTLGTRRVVTAQPGPDSRYTIGNLPPGDYYVAVVTDFEIEQRLDPAFLRQLASIGSRVTVTLGGRHTQDLKGR